MNKEFFRNAILGMKVNLRMGFEIEADRRAEGIYVKLLTYM